MTSTPATATPPDPRPLLLRAAEVADCLIAQIRPEDLGRPTPCTDFDVRGLLDHLVLVIRRVQVVLHGGDFTSVPLTSGLTDAELAGAWRTGLDDVRRDASDIDLTATVTAPFGTVPAAAAAGLYVNELTVHAWDLAVALDRTELLDTSWAEGVLAAIQPRLPREGRENLPFGEVVDLPADAPAYDQLLAWMGRDPRWSAI